MPENKPQIRNSTVDFLLFTKGAHEEGIAVRVQDNTVWLTQKAIGQLFDVDRSVVTKHLKKIFESGILRVLLPKKGQNRLPKSNLIVIEKQKRGRLRGRKVSEPVYVPLPP